MKKLGIITSLNILLLIGSIDITTAQFDIIQFDKNSDEYSSDVVLTNDGNYLGLTIDDAVADTRLHLFKFSIDGTVLWDRYFSHPNLETVPFYLLPSIIKHDDGNYTILYTNENPNVQTAEPFSLLIKVDEDGRVIWREEYECCFYDQIVRPNGEIWLGGDFYTPPSGRDFRLKRINQNGTEISNWDYFYSTGGFNAPEQFFQMSTSTNDEVVLSGIRNLGNSEMIHLRIASDGALLNELEFGNRNTINHDLNVISTADGGSMYITSYVFDDHSLISKIDNNGELLWSNKIDSGSDYRNYENMIPWNDGAVASGIISYGGQSGPADLLITVFDKDGNVTNDFLIDLQGNTERIVSVIPDANGGLLFFGWIAVPETTGGSNLNPFIFGVEDLGRGVSHTSNLLTNTKVSISPNPTASQSTLEIEQDVFQKGKLIISDINGKTVIESLVTENRHLIELSGLLPAVYMVQLFNEREMVWTGKIMKL